MVWKRIVSGYLSIAVQKILVLALSHRIDYLHIRRSRQGKTIAIIFIGIFIIKIYKCAPAVTIKSPKAGGTALGIDTL